MHNASYEMIIGRHGLVSEGFLLWKVGVQHAYTYLEKYVDAFPHSPQDGYGRRQPLKVIPPSPLFSQEDTRLQQTGLSTPKNNDPTDELADLSPLSTQPTITTTIYINRRGIAQ